jgi:hypothetical protein
LSFREFSNVGKNVGTSHTRAYTVKVPAQWAGINSARAQNYLREFFIHPLALPADPGAGECVLRLTLNERQVDALSRGSGEVPAVALRRLLVARVRELPAASSAVSESRAIVPAWPKTAEAKRGASPHRIEPPAWFDPQNANRLSYWRALGTDYQLEMIEGHRIFEGEDRGGKMDTQKKTVRQLSALERAVRWVSGRWFPLLVVGVVLIVLGRKLGWFAASAGTAGAAPAFPAWKPV